MTRDDRENEIRDYVGYLDTLLATLRARLTGRPRVIVVGFSQGAATGARWVSQGNAVVDHLVLWGGTVPPEIDLAGGPSVFRDVPVTLVAGTRDQYITPELAARENERLEKAGITHQLIAFEGGHVISRSALRKVAAAI
jgi:predicted esterase